MPFELNYRYHLCIFYKKDVNSHFESKTTNMLTKKLANLIAVYRKNIEHI